MLTRSGLLIGRVFGIPIYLDLSWFFLFMLLTITLRGQFADEHTDWGSGQQWSVALATSALFFASVIFHELAHSMVARRYKIPVVSITLFVFGGLARIGREPSKAIQEFNIAIAGPIASLLLAAAFYGVTRVSPGPAAVSAVAHYLADTNLVLALFNLLPGFPLDGGRIFRAIVWAMTKDFARATRVAAGSGKLIAYAMISFGAWYALTQQQWHYAIWLVIGWFMLNAAQQSVAQIEIKETLTGLRAADVMSQEVPTIARDISLEDYGHEALRTGRRCHLVVTDDRLVGMMNVHTLNAVPRQDWNVTSVQAVMIPRDKILLASPEEPLLGLLERLLAADVNQMPVVDGTAGGAHIIGMVTRDSILRVMRTRAEVGPLVATR